MWSLIISPEDAERIDLRQHARDLVAGMERDLGTQLEWVAIDHHNTDDEHVHLLIRGVRDDGRDLTLDRDYISRGMRELSRELVERELGPRTEQEYLQTRAARHRTRIMDRNRSRAGAARGTRSGGQLRKFRALHARARGCAPNRKWSGWPISKSSGWRAQIGERSWELAPEHEPELRRRQREHDIIKTRARERQQERDRER